MRHLLAIPFLLATATAQSVLPPFSVAYQVVRLGPMPGIFSYGGTAFLPSNPNVLLISPWPSTEITAVIVTRDGQGFINGLSASTPVATVGGTDGGLAFGPTGVLFHTWFGPNRLGQILPGSTVTNRSDDLGPLGLLSSVGACTFVPAGLPGAGRFKVCGWSGSDFHDVTLTPDGLGTFTPTTTGTPIILTGGIEGIVYVPANAPLLGGQLLTAEWGPGIISAYQIDANGDPIASTRQVVIGGANPPGGGAVDPITGDIVFATSGGELIALRSGQACGTSTSYGIASPGLSGTPTLSGAGCANIGQTMILNAHGAPFGLGLLATGYQLNFVWEGLTILQSLDATVISVLDVNGNWALPLAIPLAPALGYQHVYFQVAYLDASTQSGLVASAGLDVLVR